MGWAIRRPDGTYRCWNANTKDDVLQPGEVWDFLNTPPQFPSPISLPNPLIARIDAALASTDLPLTLRALLVTWKNQL